MESLLEWNKKEEKLVALVKQNSFLYDKKHKDYRRQMLSEKTWNDIATELNVTVDYVKRRWKTIKDRYLRLKKLKEASPEDKKVIKYRFFHMLNFLDNYCGSDGSTTSNNEDLKNQPVMEFEAFKQENLFDDYEFQPTDSQHTTSSSTNNFITEVHADISNRRIHETRTPAVAANSFANTNNDLVISLLKTARNDIKPMTKERGFCESLALQLEDANLPSENFRDFQIKVIQLLSNEIAIVKAKSESVD